MTCEELVEKAKEMGANVEIFGEFFLWMMCTFGKTER